MILIYAVLKTIKFHRKKMKDELITVKYAKMGHSILEAF